MIKKKIFTEKDKEALYRKAFNDAREDLEETRLDDVEKRAIELAEKKLLGMLSVVDPNFIVTVDPTNGFVFIGGKKADAIQLNNLRSEAELLTAGTLWKLLYETPNKLAQDSMFVKGETLADMQKGKSMLYTLSTQKKIIDTFLSYGKK